MVSPISPAATRSFTLSQGYSSAASQRAVRSRKTVSASSRARTRSASWSAVNLKSMRLDVDGMAEGGQRRLERRLGQGGMGVDGVDDLLEGGLQRAPHRELVDQLGGLGTDDVHAQQLAGGLVRDHLDETLGVAERD